MNYDVVLHLDSNDPAKMRLVLRNAANYLNALPGEDFQLHIAANGGGAVLFTDDHEVFRKEAALLKERGARFKICANALAEHGIDPARVWPECEIVPAGLVEVVRLQREGFAYIKP